MAPVAEVVKAAADEGKVLGNIVVKHATEVVHKSGGGFLAMFYEVVTLISVLCIIFGGVVPYIPQYSSIRKTKDSEGFSTFVCLVLLIANILRILFWFGKHYELPLLLQSIVMIVTMMAMMHVCVTVNTDKTTTAVRLRDLKVSDFWKWTNFQDYCVFLLVFVAVMSVVTFMFVSIPAYVEVLGLFSLLMEACLGLPQLWKNYVKKSTEGMSVKMVVMWLSGDLFKTCYFLVRSSPAQFWLCGSLQIIVDILILLQVYFHQQTNSQTKPIRP